MPKFRKKPVVIEAVQLKNDIMIKTKEGLMKGNKGGWLITGVENEQYVCDHNIFLKTYEPVDNEATEYLENAKKGINDEIRSSDTGESRANT